MSFNYPYSSPSQMKAYRNFMRKHVLSSDHNPFTDGVYLPQRIAPIKMIVLTDEEF